MKTTFPAKAKAQGLCTVPFEFLNAKLRGRRSWLYEGARLRALARASIMDLAYDLYPHEDIRNELDLERHVVAACIEELTGLGIYLAGAYHTFYCALLDRYVVENLKVLLRLWGRQGDGNAAARYLVQLPLKHSLPVDELLGSPSIEDFLRRIPLETVRECAQHALPLYQETGRKACLEMAFDRGYWKGVQQALELMPTGERKRCLGPVRRELDAMKLLATLRAARVYGIPWERLQPVLPVGPGEIDMPSLRRTHQTPELQTVLACAAWLRRLELTPDQVEDIGQLEEVLWRDVVRLANRQYYKVPGGYAVLVSYYYLKRNELRHLLSLIQMVRYGTHEEKIAEYLEV